MSELWNHQLKAVEFAEEAIEHHGGCLLAMEMGTGKTRCALEIAARLSEHQDAVSMLVICPNNVISVWEREAAAHLNEHRIWTRRDIAGTLAKAEKHLAEFMESEHIGISIAVVNYEAISSSKKFAMSLADHGWDIMIADESHRLKNSKANRSKRAAVIARKSEICIGMTGTPRPNSQMDIWHQMCVLAPKSLPKVPTSRFEKWLKMKIVHQVHTRQGRMAWTYGRYGVLGGRQYKTGDHIDVIVKEWHREPYAAHIEITDRYNSAFWNAEKVEGKCGCRKILPNLGTEQERAAWFRNEMKPLMHVIKARDVLDLPDYTVTQFSYVSSPSVAAAYEQMIFQMQVATEQGQREAGHWIALPGYLQRILCGIMEEKEITEEIDGREVSVDKRSRKEREFTTDPDYELRKEMLASWMDDNESEDKLVVYCHHQACMDAVHEVAAKRGGSAEMSGRRKDLDEKWRDGDARVAVVSINAGAEGISLVEARCAMFYCHNWSAEKKPQAIARLVRPGQKYPVSIVELEAHIQGRDMAMDQIMLGRVAEKMEDSEKWLAGEFG